jgi:hypothetical protein
MSFPERKRGVDKDCAECHAEARPKTLEADLNWIWIVDRTVQDGDKVDQSVVVHSSYESN